MFLLDTPSVSSIEDCGSECTYDSHLHRHLRKGAYCRVANHFGGICLYLLRLPFFLVYFIRFFSFLEGVASQILREDNEPSSGVEFPLQLRASATPGTFPC